MEIKKRLDYLDIAKGISMICIVLGHLGNWQINKFVFTFHVPLFFIITGYFTSNKEKIWSFIKKRAKTLLLPYYVTSFLIILLSIPINVRYHQDWKFEVIRWIKATIYAAGDSHEQPFMIYSIGALWFLWATFWGCVLLRMLINQRKEVRFVSVFALFFLTKWSTKFFWFPLSIQTCGESLFYMYVGWLVKQNQDVYKRMDVKLKYVLSLFAFGVWIWFIRTFKSFWLVHCDLGRGWIDIFASLCACWCVLCICMMMEKYMKNITKPFAYLGKYSLLMLCMHIIELNLFPWWRVINRINGIFVLSETQQLWMKAGLKFVWILPMVILCSKINVLRKLFGYSEK